MSGLDKLITLVEDIKKQNFLTPKGVEVLVLAKQELAELRKQLETTKKDLHDSSAQLLLDDDVIQYIDTLQYIIIDLRKKLEDANADAERLADCVVMLYGHPTPTGHNKISDCLKQHQERIENDTKI